MAFSIGGSKNKNKSSGTATNTLSDRAVGAIEGQIGNLRDQTYQRFDPASISTFQSPYTRDVIDASLATANQQDAIARNQQDSEFAKAGAFGDTRRGVYQAELAGNQSRDRAALVAGLNDQAFRTALEAAMGENNSANQFNQNQQSLINQLIAMYGQEGTQKTTGKSSGYNLGGSFSYGGK